MSIWDYFAANAPEQLTSDETSLEVICEVLGISRAEYDWKIHWPKLLAIMRARYADAMLAERGAPDPRLDAAGEMLKALKSLAATVLGLNDDHEETRRDIPELRLAEAAIKKAEAAGLKF